jgi:hypothetical protein
MDHVLVPIKKAANPSFSDILAIGSETISSNKVCDLLNISTRQWKSTGCRFFHKVYESGFLNGGEFLMGLMGFF